MPRSVKSAEPKTFGRKDMADLLGVTPTTFDRHWRDLIPAELITRRNNRVRFKPAAVRAIIDAKMDEARRGAAPASANGKNREPIPTISPMEAVKLEAERLKLLELTRRLISIDDAFELFGSVAEHIRRGFETLKAKHGDEAAALMEQQLKRAGKELEQRIADRDPL